MLGEHGGVLSGAGDVVPVLVLEQGGGTLVEALANLLMAVIGAAWGSWQRQAWRRPRQKIAPWGVCFLFIYALKIVSINGGTQRPR